MIPALHWAITSAGCEMMNNGAPTTGNRRLSLRTFGNAIDVPGISRSFATVGASDPRPLTIHAIVRT